MDKRALFASCVARTLKGQLAFEPKARPEVEATVARLDIDFAAAVRGNSDQVWTADLLWSRLRKDRILAIARDTLGVEWAQAHGKDKKAALAAAMQNAFAHGDGVPAGVTAAGRAAAIAWTPPGFRAFDLGAADTGTAIDNNKKTTTAAPKVAVSPDHNTEPAPAETPRPINAPVHAVVESLNAPADDDAVCLTIAGGGRDVSVEREQVLAPPRGKGQDTDVALPEIPAFLRRV